MKHRIDEPGWRELCDHVDRCKNEACGCEVYKKHFHEWQTRLPVLDENGAAMDETWLWHQIDSDGPRGSKFRWMCLVCNNTSNPLISQRVARFPIYSNITASTHTCKLMPNWSGENWRGGVLQPTSKAWHHLQTCFWTCLSSFKMDCPPLKVIPSLLG